MKLRKVLFFVSLLFLVSCEVSDNDRVAKLENQLDSLTNAHRLSVDSLNRVVADYQIQLSDLKIREAAIRDSIAKLAPNQENKPRVYPDPKPSGRPDTPTRKPVR